MTGGRNPALRNRALANGPASGVLTRRRLGCDAQVNSDRDPLIARAETEVRRGGMGVKISPHKRGAERLPYLRNGRRLTVPRSPLAL